MLFTYEQAQKSLENLKDYLQEQGWTFNSTIIVENTGCSWYAHKRLPEGTSMCNCNDKEPSLLIYPWLISFGKGTSKEFYGTSCEVELCATATPSPSIPYDDNYNQDWVNFKYYNIRPEDIPKKLPKITRALTQAWEAVWSVEHEEI